MRPDRQPGSGIQYRAVECWQRQAYENASYNISDSQFLLMEQNEDDVPQTIHRMLENERYQDKVRRDKNILEAQKNQWEIEREDITQERKISSGHLS